MKLGAGVTDLTDKDLERLLRALHKGELPTPLRQVSLHRAGLSYLADKVDFLQGMNAAALRAVLVAVLAERRRGRGPALG